MAFGRTYSEQRFSPLAQVNDATVNRLAPDWVVELPTDRGLVSTPLVVDGVMYFIGGMNVVRAVTATSGTLLWEFDPEIRAVAGQMRAGGTRAARGMPAYADITDQELTALQHFIRQQAEMALRQKPIQ